VRRLKQRRAATGETAPRPSGRRPRTWAADADRIRRAFRDTPDATLAEVKARLGLAIGLTTLWRAVAALGLTVKKKSSGRPSRTART
jgi:transposase